MVKLANTTDLKSVGSNTLRVRFPSPALIDMFKYNIMIDYERCPYTRNQPEYYRWILADDTRLKAISEARELVVMAANEHLSHPDKKIRDMALLITTIFRG